MGIWFWEGGFKKILLEGKLIFTGGWKCFKKGAWTRKGWGKIREGGYDLQKKKSNILDKDT